MSVELTPEMKKIIDCHNFLKTHSNESLWEMVIKDIQNYILEYFKTNRIAESDNNIVSYDFPNLKNKNAHELTENILKIIETSYIPYGYCILNNKHDGKYLHLMNNKPFIDMLAMQIGYPTLALSLYFSDHHEYLTEYGDCFITTLDFEFNLKEDVEYETGTNKIIDFLLNKRMEKEKAQTVSTQYDGPKEIIFADVCKAITDNHFNIQQLREENKDKEISYIYEFAQQLDLYEIYALIQLQDKSTFFEYPYVEYYCNQYGVHYEFSKDESAQLSRLVGINVDLLFKYKNNRIYIVFDENHKLDVPEKVIEKCKKFLVKNREKSHNDIIKCVTKNKARIIDKCIHILKCEKQSSRDIERDIVSLLDDADNDDFKEYKESITCLENILVIDPDIITDDLENKVYNILGLQGFKLCVIKYSGMYDDDDGLATYGLATYGIGIRFPDDLINLYEESINLIKN